MQKFPTHIGPILAHDHFAHVARNTLGRTTCRERGVASLERMFKKWGHFPEAANRRLAINIAKTMSYV